MGMSTITFDTLKFADRLEKAGATRELAHAMAEAQKESLAEVMDVSVATRADLAATKAELKADIALVRTDMVELRKDMQAMEMRLTIKLGGFLIAAVGILYTLLKH